MTNEEIIYEILRAPLQSNQASNESIIKAKKNWYQIITPSYRDASKNEIIICEIDNEDPRTLFEKEKETYESQSLPFKWCWNPFSKPESLEEILKEECSTQWEYCGIACNPSTINTSYSSELSVERVKKENVETYLEVYSSGWKTPCASKDSLRNIFLSIIEDPNKGMYIAKIGKTPAGVADFQINENSAYLGGAVVLEEYRGKGLYKALVMERLKELVNRRVNLVVTQARSKTSAPILEKFGMTVYFRNNIYQFN